MFGNGVADLRFAAGGGGCTQLEDSSSGSKYYIRSCLEGDEGALEAQMWCNLIGRCVQHIGAVFTHTVDESGSSGGGGGRARAAGGESGSNGGGGGGGDRRQGAQGAGAGASGDTELSTPLRRAGVSVSPGASADDDDDNDEEEEEEEEEVEVVEEEEEVEEEVGDDDDDDDEAYGEEETQVEELEQENGAQAATQASTGGSARSSDSFGGPMTARGRSEQQQEDRLRRHTNVQDGHDSGHDGAGGGGRGSNRHTLNSNVARMSRRDITAAAAAGAEDESEVFLEEDDFSDGLDDDGVPV